MSATLNPPLRPPFTKQAHFYFRRIITSSPLRRPAIRFLQTMVGRYPSNNKIESGALATLKRDGIVTVSDLLSEQQRTEIVHYLADKPIHDRHDATPRRTNSGLPLDMQFGFYDTQDIIDCPHVMSLVSSPRLVDLAAEYLGCVPTLCCLGAHWSFPKSSPETVQKFHRDCEDWKYLRFIMYLTDVGEGDGPHVYVKQSHQGRLPFRLRFYPEEELDAVYGQENILRVLGPAGTCVVADTAGIHKGELPVDAPRLVLSFTYSILPPPLFHYQPLPSHHPQALRNYTNRLFLQR